MNYKNFSVKARVKSRGCENWGVPFGDIQILEYTNWGYTNFWRYR